MSTFGNASLNLRARTATIGGHTGERHTGQSVGGLGPAEAGVLAKINRGQALTVGEQAIACELRDTLINIYNAANAPGRMATPAPTSSVSAADFHRNQRELERLKKRHAAPAQTIDGRRVQPIATLKNDPPRVPIYSRQNHR